jgi:phosphotriesterase-related protein
LHGQILDLAAERRCPVEEPDSYKKGKIDRRGFLAAGAGAAAAAGITGSLAAAQGKSQPTEPSHPHQQSAAGSTASRSATGSGGGVVLETVTGPLRENQVEWALEHEHLFVDFLGAKDPAYQDVDWADVTGACVNSVLELRAQGVNLYVEYTPMGVGRNVLLTRNVARQTGMAIVCASGIYRASFGIPPEFRQMGAAELGRHFFRELTLGVDGSHIRAGFIKIAVDDDGPKPADVVVYRAAARAAKRTGCTIGMHAFAVDAMRAARRILVEEGFDLRRFVWAHANYTPTIADHMETAARGSFVSYDAVTVGGAPTEEVLLDWIEEMIAAGFGGKVLLSTDSTIYVNPQASQYGYQNTYLFRVFKPKLEARFGAQVTQKLLRDNVIVAYRRGDNVT